jgi:hypothetical protein
MKKLGKETLDFAAHASSAFLALVVAGALGAWFTAEAAVFVAWALGFVSEFTEWQDGGRHPFTLYGLLDQLGWVVGGLVYVGLVL